MSSRVSGRELLGKVLVNKSFLLSRRADRCPRSKGRGGWRRKCGRRWGGTLSLPEEILGEVLDLGRRERSGAKVSVGIGSTSPVRHRVE